MKLNVTTNQEAFDAVVAHLRPMRQRSVDDHGNCMYRTPGGNRCAIGALIPDEEYNEIIEGKSVDALFHKYHSTSLYADFPRLETEIDSLLLVDLQKVHDETANWLFVEDHGNPEEVRGLSPLGTDAITSIAWHWSLTLT